MFVCNGMTVSAVCRSQYGRCICIPFPFSLPKHPFSFSLLCKAFVNKISKLNTRNFSLSLFSNRLLFLCCKITFYSFPFALFDLQTWSTLHPLDWLRRKKRNISFNGSWTYNFYTYSIITYIFDNILEILPFRLAVLINTKTNSNQCLFKLTNE